MAFKAGKAKAIDTSSLDRLGQSVIDLAQYTEDEFAQAAAALQGDDPFTVNYVLPTRPRTGTLAYADGTHWNPGSGEGFYEFTAGGVWVPCFVNSASITPFLPATGVTSIAGNTGAFTLNATSGITHSVNDIQLSQASASQFGAVKVDGTTITASGGVISATAASLTKITASLGADVALNNTANYFDGPSVAQGSSGTWFASGTVTVDNTAGVGVANVNAKLWDGTTVVASTRFVMDLKNLVKPLSVSLSGVFTSPAGNIRISIQDASTTTGKIVFNGSGNSKDSTITAVKIA